MPPEIRLLISNCIQLKLITEILLFRNYFVSCICTDENQARLNLSMLFDTSLLPSHTMLFLYSLSTLCTLRICICFIIKFSLLILWKWSLFDNHFCCCIFISIELFFKYSVFISFDLYSLTYFVLFEVCFCTVVFLIPFQKYLHYLHTHSGTIYIFIGFHKQHPVYFSLAIVI